MTTNSQLFEFENLKKHIPILGYDEKNAFEQWKCEVKEKLVELLGLPFEKCDSKFTVTEQTELCGYTRIKFTVQTEEGYYVPCYFLVPDVKGKKLPLTICLSGHGGGTAAYYVSALDERITACAPSCSVCNYEDSIAAMPHCICNHVPSIRKYFEMGDLACLIAPRKMVVAAGQTDDIFPIEGTKKAFEKIKRIYYEAGAKDNCALVIGEGGHYNYADLIWEKLHEMGV